MKDVLDYIFLAGLVFIGRSLPYLIFIGIIMAYKGKTILWDTNDTKRRLGYFLMLFFYSIEFLTITLFNIGLRGPPITYEVI